MSTDESNDRLEAPLTFREHYDKLEAFVDECNSVLRSRGFRLCEAVVFADWQGRAIFRRSEMTNGVGPNGPITMDGVGVLPLPWTVAGHPLTVESVLNDALEKLNQGAIARCGQLKVLRLGFGAYARKMSRTVAVAPPTNGNRLIMTQ